MNPSSSISRRTQVLVTAICLLAAAYAQAKNRPPAASEQQLFIGEGIAEADTEYGPSGDSSCATSTPSVAFPTETTPAAKTASCRRNRRTHGRKSGLR